MLGNVAMHHAMDVYSIVVVKLQKSALDRGYLPLKELLVSTG
jgi:hypothetical protein